MAFPNILYIYFYGLLFCVTSLIDTAVYSFTVLFIYVLYLRMVYDFSQHSRIGFIVQRLYTFSYLLFACSPFVQHQHYIVHFGGSATFYILFFHYYVGTHLNVGGYPHIFIFLITVICALVLIFIIPVRTPAQITTNSKCRFTLQTQTVDKGSNKSLDYLILQKKVGAYIS